jgi:hypothetical protein
MPINTITANAESAKYFKFKTQEFTREKSGKKFTIKEPCFSQWNGEAKEEIYVSNSFGGELAKLTLGEAKERQGSKGIFYTQDVFFEFHSKGVQGELVKEVVVISRNTSVCETVISKLYGATTFNKIDIVGGQYLNKETGKYSDYVLVLEDGKKLEKYISVKYVDSKIPQPEGLIEIPPLEFNTLQKKNPVSKIMEETKTIKPEWLLQKDEIFDVALEVLIGKVATYKETNLKEYSSSVEETVSAEPEISIDDIEVNTDELTVIMPY